MKSVISIRGRVAAAAAALVTVASMLGSAPAQAQSSYDTFDSTVGIFNCSASVVQLPESRDSDRALVLTNGHCIQPVLDRYLNRGEVVTNRSLGFLDKGYFKNVTFYGGSSPTQLTTGTLTDLVYATMDNTDIAILRVDKTYGQLKASGVKVRPLSSSHPVDGTSIEIPSTYWQRAYSCNIDGFAHELQEGPWLWRDAIRYSYGGCEVQAGSSGSPIVDVNTGAVIGINNTAVEGGAECAMGNPCEVDPYGNKATNPGRSYGTQTYYIPTCFNNSTLAMNKAGCELPRG